MSSNKVFNKKAIIYGLIILLVLFFLITFFLYEHHPYITSIALGIFISIIMFLIPYILRIYRNFAILNELQLLENSKLTKLIKLIENINEDISFDGILSYMYHSFREFIPFSHIGIALLKDDGELIEASYGISDPELRIFTIKLLGVKAILQETSLYNIIKNGEPRIINDFENHPKNNQAMYNIILNEAGIKSSITLPLKLNNEPIGIIFFSSLHKNIYKQEHVSFLKTLSSSMAISLNKNLFIDELLFSNVLSLAKLAEARDEDTGEHLDRMKQYSLSIAEYLYKENVYPELTIQLIKDIHRFSPMHDIGKVGIRDGILLKPGKLTKDEFEEMKRHTIYGAEVLKAAEDNMVKVHKSMFKIGIEIALGHHEWWNGSGYPYQKSGEEIPLSARIVAVADVFDALTSKRPYKEAFSFEKAFKIIEEGKGTHFDPKIIKCLIRYKENIYRIYKDFHHIN